MAVQAKTSDGKLAYITYNGIPFIKRNKKYICVQLIKFLGNEQCDLEFNSFKKLINHKHERA